MPSRLALIGPRRIIIGLDGNVAGSLAFLLEGGQMLGIAVFFDVLPQSLVYSRGQFSLAVDLLHQSIDVLGQMQPVLFQQQSPGRG